MRTRQVWLDLARGLAVVSMVVAHTAPAGGIFNVSEYLTAPLFAAVIGAGVWLSWRSWTRGRGSFVAAQAIRGAMLVVMGLLLQPVYWQIVVVLQWLGVVTLATAVAVVLGARGRSAGLAGAALLAVSPPLMTWARTAAPGGPLGDALQFVIAGPYYRAVPMVGYALLGVALVAALDRAPSPRRPLWAAVAGAGLAAAAVAIGKSTGLGADPYSGTYPELAACVGLVVAALAGCRWVALRWPRLARALDPLAATGRMAMTAYVAQSVILRLLTEGFLDGGRDDHWWVMGTTIALIVALCWAWDRGLGRGPFERLLRIHRPLFRSTG